MNDDPLSRTEAQLTRWIDNAPGAIPPENMDPREATRLRADAEAVAALLRQHVPTSVEPPYPEFFNSQILKHVRDSQPAGASARSDGSARSWLQQTLGWLTGHRGLALAATAGLVALALTATQWERGRPTAGGTRVVSVFSPEPNATARIQESASHGAVIISIDGLEAFPDDRAVVGQLIHEPRPLVAVYTR